MAFAEGVMCRQLSVVIRRARVGWRVLFVSGNIKWWGWLNDPVNLFVE